jgi:hypothetical protein
MRFAVLACTLALAAAPVLANTHKEAPGMAPAGGMTKQQSKMGTCNASAGDKKGDERKAYMKECLSAEKMSQQDKMKKCNADATGKKGEDRKAFMKTCLSA